MILELQECKTVETTARRVLGALELVDAVTGLPLIIAAEFKVLGIETLNPNGPPPAPAVVAFTEDSVRLRRNRRGRYVILSAPGFDDYIHAFEQPKSPPGLIDWPSGSKAKAALVLRVRLAITCAGPHYLPRQFTFELPRPLDATKPGSVFEAIRVPLFRAPTAAVPGGSAVLRVSVQQARSEEPLPGVLLTIRTSRAGEERLVGQGMTEWRGRALGEALVPLPGLRHFSTGDDTEVVVLGETIRIEAARDRSFVGAAGTYPDVRKIADANAPDVIKPPDHPPQSVLEVIRPAGELKVTPGQDVAVTLGMP